MRGGHLSGVFRMPRRGAPPSLTPKAARSCARGDHHEHHHCPQRGLHHRDPRPGPRSPALELGRFERHRHAAINRPTIPRKHAPKKRK